MDNLLTIKKKREVGRIISDGIAFMRENFGVLLKTYLIYIVPFMILMGYAMSHYMGEIFSLVGSDSPNFDGGIIIWVIVLLVSVLLGYTLLHVAVFGGMIHCAETNGKLEFENIKASINKNFMRIMGAYLIFILAIFAIAIVSSLIVGLIPFLGGVLFLVGFFVLIYYAYKLYFFAYAMMDEEIGLGQGLRRSSELVDGHWWSTFGVLFLVAIIVALVGQVFSIPSMLFGGFSFFSGLETGEMPDTLGFWAIFWMVFSSVGTGFLQIYSTACSGLLYYDLKEYKFGSSIQDKVDNFGNENDSIFENEGEY